MHLVESDGSRLPERWVTWSRGSLVDESVGSTRCGEHVRAAEGGGWHDEDEAYGGVVVDKVDRPAELTGENQSNDEVNITGLACLKDPYQFFLKTELLDLLTLFFAVLIAVILNLYR